jgi:reductive dehalogenase
MSIFKKKKLKLQTPDVRFDERNTMFARAHRKEGTNEYEEYYSRRSDLKKIDDRLRRLPPLLSPKGKYYDPKLSVQADKYFDDIDIIVPDQDVVSRWVGKLRSSENLSKSLREFSLNLGAVDSGITTIPDEYTYTHKGRLDQDYGNIIENDHKSILVFLVEMDYKSMKLAPGPNTILESAHQYYRAAVIAKTIVLTLAEVGIKAKAEFDAHYDSILPPLAEMAGLGEVGRNNILVADRYGSRVRIGGIRIDADLENDSPVNLGVESFCEICKKCAENCPSNSLSLDEKVKVNGVKKWPTHVEKCYAYWRAIGTDCGICMAACPFSHRNNWFHNIVRWVLRVFPKSRYIALYFDDLIYGRKWKMPPTTRPK